MNVQTDLFDDECLQPVKQKLNDTQRNPWIPTIRPFYSKLSDYLLGGYEVRLQKNIGHKYTSGSSPNETCVYLLLENKSCVCERKDTYT